MDKGDSVANRRKQGSGFTLLELLITLGVIALLATLAMPQFSAYKQKGYNAAAVTDLANAKIVFEAYFAENHYYP
jgi:type IV pilus assembly protein PilA